MLIKLCVAQQTKTVEIYLKKKLKIILITQSNNFIPFLYISRKQIDQLTIIDKSEEGLLNK